MGREKRSDFGGAIVALLFVVFGGLAIHDTTTYSDADSVVFPRAVSIALITLSSIYLLTWVLGRAAPAIEHERGSWPRRIAFVGVMLATSLVMPWVGFVPAAIVSFAVLMLIAMYDAWTPKRMVIYGAVGLAVVFSFYFLFAKVLQVPLPVGRWLQG